MSLGLHEKEIANTVEALLGKTHALQRIGDKSNEDSGL